MSELRDYAFHMKNTKTGEKRIKRVKAEDSTHAHCSDVGYGKVWEWTGSEPWHNVSDKVKHIGNGYYKLIEMDEKEKNEIINATAIYTGGNIYIYYGKLKDGNYFRACDDWEFIEVCNADTSTDAAEYDEFYKKHRIRTLTDNDYKHFWNNMLLWITDKHPRGNYSCSELEDRILKTNNKPGWYNR